MRSYDEPIETIEQMDSLPYIGDGIKKKIKEFLDTGVIQRFEFLKNDERALTLDLFGEVWGIGPVAAGKLYQKGLRTIEDLRKKQDEVLTDMQKIGLKYYEDFKEKIPRDEVTSLLKVV